MTYPTFHFWATVSGWPKKNSPPTSSWWCFLAQKAQKKRWVSWFSRHAVLLLEILCHWIHQRIRQPNGCFTWTTKTRKRGNIYCITINFWGSMLVFEQESFRWLKFPCLDMSWRRLKQTTTNMTHSQRKPWCELPGCSFPKNETTIFQIPIYSFFAPPFGRLSTT